MKFSLAICLLASLVAAVAAVPAQPRLPKLGEVSRQYDIDCLERSYPIFNPCCLEFNKGTSGCEGEYHYS
ncbi:unnamed protein product [Chondrus crispus]|uniref:Uncharacterized protein n=1 Tax=Chondrus crispus TaxID=2769 RepID=R7Q840_CHOCR|nr:unnamed protein product [Chondrus crispus]CDF34204.1 unnamed protein product [Chondrus crispus]|eukprot:XP_005714023.1 unnamed protein product [Chondrus crispus]